RSDLSCRSWSSARPPDGFTLIEVIGALVIFSVGVLMIVQLSGALGVRMRYAGARSELIVFADERLDSLAAEAFTALTPGTSLDTLVAEGTSFQSTVSISLVSPVLKRIDVSIVPIAGEGPSHSVTSYTSAAW
ncbi:MAG: prepilin-type N-terminal cleavage/methylation domain-containing protein, partial [Longimicrobiales bacterium]